MRYTWLSHPAYPTSAGRGGRAGVGGTGGVEGWVMSVGQNAQFVDVGGIFAARPEEPELSLPIEMLFVASYHCLSLQDVRKAVLSALPGCDRMVEELIIRTHDVNFEVTTAKL